MRTPRTPDRQTGKALRWSLRIAAAWFALNLAGVLWAWGSALLTPIAPQTGVATLDLRDDTAAQGRIVSIIGTRPTPGRGDWIGHLWVAWPESPPGAPAGTREAGYYAKDQLQAALALAGALLAPWGLVTGQPPVPGHLKPDDGWWRHFELRVRVDEARYARALAVDARWRAERRYVLRPALTGPAAGRTFGCQDYAYDVAEALGLDLPARDWARGWAHFPVRSFAALASANGVDVSALSSGQAGR